MVYLIANKEHGCCKIGCTDNLPERYAQLQGASATELTVLGYIYGDFKTESSIHRKFDVYRIKGEWFRLNEEIQSYFDTHIDKEMIPSLDRLTKSVRDVIDYARENKRTFKLTFTESGTQAKYGIGINLSHMLTISKKSAMAVIAELGLVEISPKVYTYPISDAFKVVVAGTRTFRNYRLVEEKLDYLLQKKRKVEIISGGAKGADFLGEKYARNRGYEIIPFAAKWELGRGAGPIRNREMAEYCDAVVVFWDGQSRGTLNMIETAGELNKPVKIIRY